MADRFSVSVDPSLKDPHARLDTFARALSDLLPFWPVLGEHLADEAQARWPLRRKSGRLRKSLQWTGQRLGKGGIYRARPDRLAFGTRIFYGSFHQLGSKNLPARVLLHVDEDAIGKRLGAWAVDRARQAVFRRYEHENHGQVGQASDTDGNIQVEREPRTKTAPYRKSEQDPVLAVSYSAHRSAHPSCRVRLCLVWPVERGAAIVVRTLLTGAAMRAAKLAVRDALVSDEAIRLLVPPGQIYAVERSVLPALPAVEVVGVSSEAQESGPMVKHALSIEVTVSHATEDGADEALDSIVAAVRRRLLDAAIGADPITLPDGSLAVCELLGTRWSVSAGDRSSVIRGAAVAVSCAVDE